jgi:nucleoside-diphosphate-sugar epimerase
VRLVVTGATGNIGTALLRRLPDDVDVVGLARRQPPATEPYARASWVALDLAAPAAAEQLAEVLAGADAVVHLAWEFQPSHRRDQLEQAGVGGSRAVIEAVCRAGVPHLVHMSSVGAYSPAPGRRVDEWWPTEGISTLPYSVHKVAVERALDALEAENGEHRGDLVVTRLRPGFVLQRAAGSALARYGAPAWLPAALLRAALVLPLDRSLTFPVVHSEDVADAVVQVLRRRAGGAFNLAAEPPITRDLVAQALKARPVHVPAPVLHAALATSWRLHLQPLEPGWLDLGMSVPLLDTSRARAELDWHPRYDARSTVAEALAGIAAGAGTGSPVLRPRSVVGELRRLGRRGPVSQRTLP